MEILSSTLNHIAVLFSFILIGFVLKKKNILSDGSGRTLSRLENGIFMPAVVINTFWNNCTVENISRKWIFLVYSTALLIAAVALAFIISKFLTKDEYLRKVYRYSLSVSNFGFVGTALVEVIDESDICVAVHRRNSRTFANTEGAACKYNSYRLCRLYGTCCNDFDWVCNSGI